MRLAKLGIHLTAAFALAITPSFSQSPATPANLTHTDAIGFTYSLPADWEYAEQQPATAPKPDLTSLIPDAKSGAGCVQVALTARHGNPASAIVAVTLPYDCFGQTMTAADLPGFGEGVAGGLKDAFDIAASAASTYILDGHTVWIERATGTAKGQQNPPVSTLEIACTLLIKGAVCWMINATDSPALQTFEAGLVTLDGGAPHPLVSPENAARLANLTIQLRRAP